jgi:hypothetical protein
MLIERARLEGWLQGWWAGREEDDVGLRRSRADQYEELMAIKPCPNCEGGVWHRMRITSGFDGDKKMQVLPCSVCQGSGLATDAVEKN